MVNIGDLLKHLFAVGSHFLVDNAPLVNVVLGKLFGAPKLHMLVHELRHEFGIVDELISVFLRHSILLCGYLQS